MTPEELATLTPEEKRIRIAELCGWSRNKYNWFFFSRRDGCSADKLSVNVHQLPDYLNDLNAMHEAEKTLDERQQDVFAGFLGAITGGSTIDYGATRIEATTKILFATAAQRADAFLLTRG